MEITLELLQAKLKEYEAAYIEHLGLANANHGAMVATAELIKLKTAPEKKEEVKS